MGSKDAVISAHPQFAIITSETDSNFNFCLNGILDHVMWMNFRAPSVYICLYIHIWMLVYLTDGHKSVTESMGAVMEVNAPLYAMSTFVVGISLHCITQVQCWWGIGLLLYHGYYRYMQRSLASKNCNFKELF